MPSSKEARKRRHTNEARFQPRLPKDVYDVWTGPLKGKATRYLIDGARKYLEENGHSPMALRKEILERRARVLRDETELQILEMQLAGMQGFHTPSPAGTTPPPSPADGVLPEAVEKELLAAWRSHQRSRTSQDKRHEALLLKCEDLLKRNKDLREQFPNPDSLLAEFAKRLV